MERRSRSTFEAAEALSIDCPYSILLRAYEAIERWGVRCGANPFVAQTASSLHRKCEAAFWGTPGQISSRRDFLSLPQPGTTGGTEPPKLLPRS
jgi:hypothetical protein